MKKIIFSIILVCLGAILMFTACSNNTSSSNPSANTTQKSAQTTSEKAPVTPPSARKILINGKDVSTFRIVYAAVPEAEAEAYAKYQGQLQGDTEFDRLTAEHLADVIEEWCGVRLTVVEDGEAQEQANEILVGKTNRQESQGSKLGKQKPREYTFCITEGKLVVCGGSYGATWQAVDAFELYLNQVASVDTGKTLMLELTDADDFSGIAELKAVACLGDSITFGATSTDPTCFSWPATLQRMLWRDYLVYNYGANGRSMRSDADVKAYNGQILSYMDCTPYFNCMENTVSYDLVLIMLGTNDAGNDSAWDDADDARYLENGHELVKSIKAKNKNAEIVILNCPSRYAAETASYPHVRALQKQFAEQIAENGHSVWYYDMNRYCNDRIDSAMFPDQIHPNDEGYKLMANGMKNLLMAIFEEAENTYLTDCKQ